MIAERKRQGKSIWQYDNMDKIITDLAIQWKKILDCNDSYPREVTPTLYQDYKDYIPNSDSTSLPTIQGLYLRELTRPKETIETIPKSDSTSLPTLEGLYLREVTRPLLSVCVCVYHLPKSSIARTNSRTHYTYFPLFASHIICQKWSWSPR